MILDLIQHIISKLSGISYALLFTTIFCVIPICVMIAGRFMYKKRKESEHPTVLVIVITVVLELISLTPIIGTMFFADDGILYLFYLPIAMIVTLAFLMPFVFPVFALIYIKRRQKQSEPIFWYMICFFFLELMFLTITVLWVMKDYF